MYEAHRNVLAWFYQFEHYGIRPTEQSFPTIIRKFPHSLPQLSQSAFYE